MKTHIVEVKPTDENTFSSVSAGVRGPDTIRKYKYGCQQHVITAALVLTDIKKWLLKK